MGFKNYIWDEQFDLNVALGRVRGASSIHKFGATPLQSNNTTATVWDKPDTLYPWTAFNTPGVLVAGQANASDDGKQVTIIGLDENWNEITEIFTLSSAATVSGTKTFKRVYRGYVSSGGQNIGNISFNRDGTEVLRITAGLGQTLMSIYSVPAGYTAFLYQGTASTQVGGDGTGFMYVRYTDETAFRVGHTFEVDGSGGQYFYKFAFPQRIPEKSDVDIRITSRSNNGRFTAAFDILLIKNQL